MSWESRFRLSTRRIIISTALTGLWLVTSCGEGQRVEADSGRPELESTTPEKASRPPDGGEPRKQSEPAPTKEQGFDEARDGAITQAPSDAADALGTAAGPHDAAAEALFRRARELARQRWGGRKARSDPSSSGLLRSFEEVRAPELELFLKGDRAFRATVYNPRAAIAGRPTFLYLLVVGDDESHYLESDEEARRFLTSRWVAVVDDEGARRAVRAFVALRSYEIVEAPPGPRSSKGIRAEHLWRLTVNRSNEGWTVTCGVLWDPNIHAVSHYSFLIDGRSGLLTVRQQRLLMKFGGYR